MIAEWLLTLILRIPGGESADQLLGGDETERSQEVEIPSVPKSTMGSAFIYRR